MSDEKMNTDEAIEENSNIIIKTMEEVMHDSMLPYSEHVILDRALPRVEDGLKPVQRRILYSLHELGVTHDKPYRKSARIVGDCLGKYHPHGDKSVYDAMVRMSQEWAMRHKLVDGHGNFGSMDGDGAAAMRYTEVRLAPLSAELLRDLDKDTVKWSLNFDDTTKEPDILPGRFPNLLVNGAYGIAVGLATNIPPHNLGETIDGVIAYIDNPRITLPAMMKIIKGPDFPTGGTIVTGEELLKAYETGRGKIVMYPKINIEIAEYDKRNIVITELPFQVNKAALLEEIVSLREEKKGVLSGISEINDESDRDGMRAVIRVKKDFDPREICKALFKSTALSQSFAINIVAIADGKPQQMGLLDIISYYVEYQRGIIVRRTRFELNEAKEREHILEGLMIAVKNIDEVIAIIKASSSPADAKTKLRERFGLSDRQAQAVLDIRLARLTHLEIYKLEKELKDVRSLILRLETILGSKKEQMDVIKYELGQIKRNFKEPRRSAILHDKEQYYIPSEDDAKPIENYVISYTAENELKRIPLKNYSLATREFSSKTVVGEISEILLSAKSNQVLYCFSDLGYCYKFDVDELPEGKWRDRGLTLNSLNSEAKPDERIVKIYAVEKELPQGNLLFFTKSGLVKKSAWSEYNIGKSAFQAIKLKDDDVLIGLEDEDADATILFVTKKGMCLNALTDDIPVQGRIAGGVKGIMLSDDDSCVYIGQVKEEGEVAIITDKAFAKRVIISQIDPMARYRKGVKIMDLKGDNGDVIMYASYVREPYSVVILDADDFLSEFKTDDFVIDLRTARGRQVCKMLKSNRVMAVFKYLV